MHEEFYRPQATNIKKSSFKKIIITISVSKAYANYLFLIICSKFTLIITKFIASQNLKSIAQIKLY